MTHTPSKPLVYVSGPLTTGSETANARHAVNVATALRDHRRVVPFVPHTSLLWDLIHPTPYQRWIDYDLDVIEHCDAVLRLPGASAGADQEVAFAHTIGVPVFDNVTDLYAWVDGRDRIAPFEQLRRGECES